MEVFFVLAIPIGSVANQATTNQPKKQCDNREKEGEDEREGRKVASDKEKPISQSILVLS